MSWTKQASFEVDVIVVGAEGGYADVIDADEDIMFTIEDKRDKNYGDMFESDIIYILRKLNASDKEGHSPEQIIEMVKDKKRVTVSVDPAKFKNFQKNYTPGGFVENIEL